MTDEPLASDIRSLLAVGREHLGPDAAAIARLRTRIDGAVASTAPIAAKALALKLIPIVAIVLGGAASLSAWQGSRVDAPRLELDASAEAETPMLDTRVGLREEPAPGMLKLDVQRGGSAPDGTYSHLRCLVASP